MTATVTVVIPTYKRHNKLENAINSVINQTYEDIEIIVVNDDPDDKDISEIIASFNNKRISLINNKKNIGASASRNKGIMRAEGEYISFLDDDDKWMPVKTEKQIKVMEENPDVGLVICYSIDKRFSTERINKPIVNPTHKDLLKSFNLSSTSSYMVRKSALNSIAINITRNIEKKCGVCKNQHICWSDYDIGIWSRKDLICDSIRNLLENQHSQIFDTTLPSAQEYDLAIQISKHYKIVTVPEVLMVQNTSKGQISENWGKKIKGIFMLWIKHGSDYKTLGMKGCILNHLKNVGLIGIFFLGFIFGNKIYKVIIPIKEIYEG